MNQLEQRLRADVKKYVNCPYPKGTFFPKRKGACVKAQVLIL